MTRDVSHMSDESFLRYYDGIRVQVEADRGNKYKFTTSDSIKAYAEALRTELARRRVSYTSIYWWE